MTRTILKDEIKNSMPKNAYFSIPFVDFIREKHWDYKSYIISPEKKFIN